MTVVGRDIPDDAVRFVDDEVRAILAAAEGDRFEALCKLAAATGVRQGELLALERDDFDISAGTGEVVRMLDQLGGEMQTCPPKSASGVRTLSPPPSPWNPSAATRQISVA